MEFGPARSAAAAFSAIPAVRRCSPLMNLKIKYRESFRPFAPSVLRERVADYFEMDVDSPYMLLVALRPQDTAGRDDSEQKALWGIDLLNVPRSDIPAVTHVDYSARIQTVHEDTNPRYYRLLKEFEVRPAVPCWSTRPSMFAVSRSSALPQDAYRCFMRTEMDVLVLEDCVLRKEAQTPLADDSDWKKEFELD